MRTALSRVLRTLVVLALVAVVVGIAWQAVLFLQARGVASSAAASAAEDAASGRLTLPAAAARATRQVHDDATADASAVVCTATPGTQAASGIATVTVRCAGRIKLLFTDTDGPFTVIGSSTALRDR